MSVTSYKGNAKGDLVALMKVLYSRESLEREDHLKVTYLNFHDVFDSAPGSMPDILRLMQWGFGTV